jgi:hypothetical protein
MDTAFRIHGGPNVWEAAATAAVYPASLLSAKPPSVFSGL